ncbi:MAG: hypothetical protein Q9167_004068 [Letrouitia subvulpina]
MANEPCFLEEAPWQAILHSTIRPKAKGFSDLNEMVVGLILVMLAIPSLFRDVQDLFCSKFAQRETPRPKVLLARAFKIRQGLISWHKKCEDACINGFTEIGTCHTSIPLLFHCYDFGERFETLRVCFTPYLVLNRLMIALNPTMESALYLEAESSAIATKVLRNQSKVTSISLRANPSKAFKIAVARANLDTEGAWRKEISNFSREGDAVIADVVFIEWVRLLGRAL